MGPEECVMNSSWYLPGAYLAHRMQPYSYTNREDAWSRSKKGRGNAVVSFNRNPMLKDVLEKLYASGVKEQRVPE